MYQSLLDEQTSLLVKNKALHFYGTFKIIEKL